jgi:hypothetical protein
MRKLFWQVDRVMIDLEDRDATVSMIHQKSLSEITIRFRLSPKQLEDAALPLRRRIEFLAADLVLDLGSFLDLSPD